MRRLKQSALWRRYHPQRHSRRHSCRTVRCNSRRRRHHRPKLGRGHKSWCRTVPSHGATRRCQSQLSARLLMGCQHVSGATREQMLLLGPSASQGRFVSARLLPHSPSRPLSTRRGFVGPSPSHGPWQSGGRRALLQRDMLRPRGQSDPDAELACEQPVLARVHGHVD